MVPVISGLGYTTYEGTQYETEKNYLLFAYFGTWT